MAGQDPGRGFELPAIQFQLDNVDLGLAMLAAGITEGLIQAQFFGECGTHEHRGVPS